jgi:hypothetical protein
VTPNRRWKDALREIGLGLRTVSVRTLVEQDEAVMHPLRERAFEQWRRETVFPQAVNRWIEGCRP